MRLFAAVLMLIAGMLIFSPASALPLVETKNRVYIIAGDENFPPYEYVVESEERQVYRGFNVDIMKAIALETGIEIEFRPMTWAKALKAFDEGELDAIQGMKYDANRAQRYDFSAEYLISSQTIFVRIGTYVTGLEDLVGQRIAVQEGDIAFQRLAGNPAYHLFVVADQEEAFRLLLTNEVVAVVGNKLAGQYILQRSGNAQAVKMIGPDIEPQRYGVAVRKGDDQLLELINQGIFGIKKNGTYNKIYVKWFGEPIDHPTGYYKDRLLVALSVLAALGFAVLFLSYVSYALRREVAKRTEQIAEINRALLAKNEYIRKENIYQENILNSSYSGIVTADCNGKIGFANEYAKDYLDGFSIFGEHFSKTPLREFFPDDWFESVLYQREPVRGEKDIGGRQVEYTISVLGQEEEPEGVLLNFRDVTVEKQLREQVSRKDKMESLGNLVAGIAHEIRTPLTSIKTFAELLPSKYDNPAFRNTFSQYVPQEVERLNTIVNDLLDYARPRQPFFTFINLRRLLNGILPLFSGYLGSGRLPVAIDIAESTTVYADKQQLQQVLINVLLNAIEAQMDVTEPYIKIYCSDNETEVILVIEDNGRGIDSAALSRMFDPFFTTKSNGTGLGLAISYQFIQENYGEIWAENALGGGAKLQMRVPKYSQSGVN